jgi:hypothetical protein
VANDDHRIDKHWRRPADDDQSAWIRELRNRSHDIAGWAARLEGLVVGLHRKVDTMSSADEIARGVADELRRTGKAGRDQVDRRAKQVAWLFGLVLTALQIANIVYR